MRVNKLTCLQDPFSTEHLGVGLAAHKNPWKSSIYVSYILPLPKQFLLLVVPPLRESAEVFKPFWLEIHINSWKPTFSLHLNSSPDPQSFQLFLNESYSRSWSRQSTRSLSCCYFMCIFTKTLTSFSPHTHSSFKLAVGDKKAAISASASSTNPRRNGGTWEQCWYFPERGMEGHQGSAWYSSHLFSPCY